MRKPHGNIRKVELRWLPIPQSDKPKDVKKALKSISSLITVFASFIYLILVLNPIQMMSALFYPLSPNLVRKINRWCARSIWGIWVLITECQNRVTVRFTGTPPPWQENAFVIPNHQSSLDIIVLLSLAWRCGRVGDMKWFVKDIVKYIPGIGWGMKFLDCVFVKRNWARDSRQIEAIFRKYKEAQIPLFLVSFLEGTRSTPDKLEKAQNYAKEQSLYVPQQTLVPRTKGFIATLEGLREHLDAVYDVTLGYQGEQVPGLLQCTFAQTQRYDVHLERFPVSAIPTETAALDSWIRERFEAKDKLMIHYRENGCFPGPHNSTSIPAKDWFSREKARNRPEYLHYVDEQA